jgi:hypothetical protein
MQRVLRSFGYEIYLSVHTIIRAVPKLFRAEGPLRRFAVSQSGDEQSGRSYVRGWGRARRRGLVMAGRKGAALQGFGPAGSLQTACPRSNSVS